MPVVVFVERSRAEPEVGAQVDHGFACLEQRIRIFRGHAVRQCEEEHIQVVPSGQFSRVGVGELKVADEVPKPGMTSATRLPASEREVTAANVTSG